jgi:putative ABC transport system substrate-binding protein
LLDAKRLDLLRQLVPNAKVVAMLINPKNTQAELQKSNAQEAARALGLQLVFVQASTEDEIDQTFAKIVQEHAAAVLIASDAFLHNHGDLIALLAVRHALPTSFTFREEALSGGLMSYGARIADTFHQSGIYVGRILKGEKPGDLPVQQPSKFDFVINMRTAKALDLNVPYSMQLLADEVIE